MRLILAIVDSPVGLVRDTLINTRSIIPSDTILPITLDSVDRENGESCDVLSFILCGMSVIFTDYRQTQLPFPIGEIKWKFHRTLDMVFMPVLLQAVSDAISKKVNSIEDIKNRYEGCFVESMIVPEFNSVILSNLFIEWLYNNGMTAVEPFATEQPPYFNNPEDKDFNYFYFVDVLPVGVMGE